MKTINFSWADSLRFGTDNTNRRFHKTRIIFAAIPLGIVFFSTLYLMNHSFIVNVHLRGSDIRLESYQHWLVPASLVVVSITNLTLIVVHEFDGEIDTVKCLDLPKLFLIEFVISSFVGGTLGFGIGLLPSFMSCSFFIEVILLHEPLIILRHLLGNRVVLSVIRSAVATLYFPYKAVKPHPAEALRHEI